MSTEPASSAAAPKLDPESLAIRSRPQRAIRFRRGMMAGIAAAGSASLVAVAWVALKPMSLRHAAEQEELSQPARASSSDALSRLPASYGDVPKLGPPLPGDLGRPILEHQRALAAGLPQDQSAEVALAAAAAERSRLVSETTAARQSAVLFQSHDATPPNAGSEVAAPTGDSAPVPASPLPTGADTNAQGRKAAFVASIDRGPDVNPHRLAARPSPYMLAAGSVIPASLITGLRSDLPGLVTAQVTSRVYDSPTGRILLIPQGARLIGEYDSVVAFGQKRALVAWQRIIMPDGSSLRLDNEPATDLGGYAGLEDKVDRHTWSLLKGIAMSTLVGLGSSLAFTGDSDLVRALRQSTQDASAHAGGQITSRNLDVQPTITIRPGASVRLVVHRDLVLAPWPE